MFEFHILKQSHRSAARVGILKTPHGEIETPAFVPVATRATVKTLTSAEAAALGSQLLICNTYHLHFTPGEDVVAAAGGLHQFMQWDKPLMTDSGGFQVLSLGFGREHTTGAVTRELKDTKIRAGDTPQNISITDAGVEFRSPRSGDPDFIGPRESIAIQEKLGADIIFAFDEATSPLADEAYVKESLARTHRWATQCLDAKTRDEQALFGIVQGSHFQHLREESARNIGAMAFDGFGIGGEYGIEKNEMRERLARTTALLPHEKPRHVLGVGHPEDFAPVAQGGGDTFDCIAPTHYARHGTVFTSDGRLHLRRTRYLSEHAPIDRTCVCPTCQTYTRSYIAHLIRAGELTGLSLATAHNLHYFNALAETVRQRIKNDEL